jgi:hypothetical protein
MQRLSKKAEDNMGYSLTDPINKNWRCPDCGEWNEENSAECQCGLVMDDPEAACFDADREAYRTQGRLTNWITAEIANETAGMRAEQMRTVFDELIATLTAAREALND